MKWLIDARPRIHLLGSKSTAKLSFKLESIISPVAKDGRLSILLDGVNYRLYNRVEDFNIKIFTRWC